MKLYARIQEMAQSEILRNIPASAYMAIKEIDANPEFRAYVIGEDGESTGTLVGVGAVIKRWAKAAIRGIVDRIQEGLPLFRNHNHDNSTDNRVTVGRAVGRFVRQVADKTQAVIIAYIDPKYRDETLDAASIEADIELEPGLDGVANVSVTKLTGVALGDSRKFKPGFASAGLVARLQEFEKQIKVQESNMPTKDELKKMLTEAGYQPSDVFDESDIKRDRWVVGHIERSFNAEYKRREEAQEAATLLKAKLEEIEGENKKLKRDITRGKITGVVDEIIKKRNAKEEVISTPMVKFIRRELVKGSIELPEDEAKLPEVLSVEIDRQIDEYKELFGEMPSNGTPPPTNGVVDDDPPVRSGNLSFRL